ncbi:hypothetical protein EYF80_027660 [Liparis tanakae]|uniref:Uncharacterized protein n=1 Tax=Liparis tanakae TaxID=230148 RepID=A0A4Z2H8C6_9TELE|nr:hypothetical protein EYF80_027660 [Liparis tanakae]
MTNGRKALSVDDGVQMRSRVDRGSVGRSSGESRSWRFLFERVKKRRSLRMIEQRRRTERRSVLVLVRPRCRRVDRETRGGTSVSQTTQNEEKNKTMFLTESSPAREKRINYGEGI